MTRITRTDDPDLAVTFDDLAEFTSALHRRSNFHFSTPKFYWFCLKKLVHPFALRRLLHDSSGIFFTLLRLFFHVLHYPNTTQETYTNPFPKTSIFRNWFVTPSKLSLMLFTVLRAFSFARSTDTEKPFFRSGRWNKLTATGTAFFDACHIK